MSTNSDLIHHIEALSEDSDKWWNSYMAIEVAGSIAVPYLIRSINSNNYLLRSRSIDLLGKIGDTQAIEPLRKAALISKKDFCIMISIPQDTELVKMYEVDITVQDLFNEYRQDAKNAYEVVSKRIKSQASKEDTNGKISPSHQPKTLNIKSIKIGNQEWMRENLNVNTFRNGDPIHEAKTKEEWEKAGDNCKPVWCYYDHDKANGTLYGRLYNWYCVNDPRGLAPKGWHVPSHHEWEVLIYHLGHGDIHAAGGKMKEKGTKHWETPNAEATDESGFTALPSGVVTYDGNFHRIRMETQFWSSTEDFDDRVWSCNLYFYYSRALLSACSMSNGFSVRCIRD